MDYEPPGRVVGVCDPRWSRWIIKDGSGKYWAGGRWSDKPSEALLFCRETDAMEDRNRHCLGGDTADTFRSARNATRKRTRTCGQNMPPKPGGWFFCERGEMHIDRAKFNIVPERLKNQLTQDTGNIRGASTKPHIRNFLECIKTREKPNADVEIGHRSVTVAHLANIARWVGERLEWNPVKERFRGNRKANGMLDRERRAGYELPEA